MTLRKRRTVTAAGALLFLAAALAAASGAALGQDKPSFGGKEDTAYAEKLWTTLAEERLVGPRTFVSVPYEGQEPHGAILITLEGMIEVGGHEGIVMVKKNYAGENVTKEKVAAAPGQNLDSITVMYQRKKGYDPDHQDWYWVKYKPDGSLLTNPEGTKLAGRTKGCIACHQSAPGDDYVFTHDRLTKD